MATLFEGFSAAGGGGEVLAGDVLAGDAIAAVGDGAAADAVLGEVVAGGGDSLLGEAMASAGDLAAGMGEGLLAAAGDAAMSGAMWIALSKWLLSGGAVAVAGEIAFAAFAIFMAVQGSKKDEDTTLPAVEDMTIEMETAAGAGVEQETL